MSVRILAPGLLASLICVACGGGSNDGDKFGDGASDDGSGGDDGAGDDGSGGPATSGPDGGAGSGTSGNGSTGGGAGSSSDDAGSTGPASTSGAGDTTATGATTTDDPTGCDPVCLDVGDGGTTGPGPVCGMSNYIVEPDRSDLMLLLDASGSMVNAPLWWDHDGDGATPTISRWRSLHNVVETIVGTFDATINLGMQMFPVSQPGVPLDDKECTVASSPEVPVGAMTGADILSILPPKDAYQELIGNPTPTRDGMEAAVAHIEGSPREKAIILVSDGAVSEPCFNTYDETLAVIDDAYRNKGIRTYVVGVALQGAWIAGYNGWAQAGGAPLPGGTSYYDVRNEIELLDALQQISGDNVSCVAPLDPEPPNPQMVQIQLNGNIVPPAADCSTDDGWVYTNPNGPYDEIELCGSFCAMFKSGGGEVLALYNCPPEG